MNALDILDLKPGNTLEDAKRNFRRLSLIYHTDKKTGNVEKFQQISDAYSFIKNNPQILNNRSEKIDSNDSSYVYINLSVTIEEVYLGKVKRISAKQRSRCTSCNGTGSTEGEEGVCSLCSGEGVSDSRILSLMGKQKGGKCPGCNGLGFKPGTACKTCHGNKSVSEVVTHTIKLKPEYLFKKYIILPGKGGFAGYGRKNLDIFFRLVFKNDPTYSIEKNVLCRKVKISQAQKIIKDNGYVDIFGVKFPYKIPEEENHFTIYNKKIPYGIGSQILLRFEIVPTKMNEKLYELYRSIVEEEKKLNQETES